jgi:hypothetical protein
MPCPKIVCSPPCCATDLEIGKQMVTSLQTLTRVECGFASIENVLTKERADIMDSFFLAETLKYLYLLFDSDHWIRRQRYIFNTEGHPFPLRPGRPNMTATRVADWEAVLDTWLDDGGTEKQKEERRRDTESDAARAADDVVDTSTSDSTSSGKSSGVHPVTGKLASADRFVKLAGQCIVPGFYSRVASRGLNYTLLTSDDLIKGYLPEDDSESGDGTEAAAAAAAQIMKLNPSTDASGDGPGLPDKLAELAGQWMQQIFGQQQAAAAAAAAAAAESGDGASSSGGQAHGSTKSDSSSDGNNGNLMMMPFNGMPTAESLAQLMESAGMTMTMNDNGEVTLEQKSPPQLTVQETPAPKPSVEQKAATATVAPTSATTAKTGEQGSAGVAAAAAAAAATAAAAAVADSESSTKEGSPGSETDHANEFVSWKDAEPVAADDATATAERALESATAAPDQDLTVRKEGHGQTAKGVADRPVQVEATAPEL